MRRHVGIVFQAFNLFPHMTVLRNITLAPVKVLHTPRAQADEEARALLGRFGLLDKAGDYPDRLSGGQQQRVAIVRALAMKPQIMLLDEVTSALDPELVAEVLDVIRELAAGGMTMLIATHEMGFARDIARRVCFLEEGRIIEDAAGGAVQQPGTRPSASCAGSWTPAASTTGPGRGRRRPCAPGRGNGAPGICGRGGALRRRPVHAGGGGPVHRARTVDPPAGMHGRQA